MRTQLSTGPRVTRRAGWCGILLLLAAALPGCFSERSFPAVPERLVHLTPAEVAPEGVRRGSRDWAVLAHERMRGLLAANAREAVTSASLFDASGKPIDVYRRMSINPDHVDSLFFNLDGMQQTAQVTSPPVDKDHPAPPWNGWQCVEIEMTDGAKLCARLAGPTRNDLGGSYIVMTHGLFGRMEGLDVRNHVDALRHAGHHVLMVDMRGHGVTLDKYPKQGLTFGAMESTDLLTVAGWLKAEHGAQRVGLLSFSITGYQAMVAAWLDAGGLTECHTAGSILFADPLPNPLARPGAYNAGIFVVSPPMNLMEAGKAFETPHTLWSGAVKSVFQERCRQRMAARGGKRSWRIWDMIEAEFYFSGMDKRFPDLSAYERDVRALLDFEGDHWAVGRRRMEELGVPVLILAAGNDPLGTAQGVVNLAAGVKNPNLGVIVLPQGGHMGFPAVSADYYYSLMLGFFDPATGPVAAQKK